MKAKLITTILLIFLILSAFVIFLVVRAIEKNEHFVSDSDTPYIVVENGFHSEFAIGYAKKWIFSHNPVYYHYRSDCANFVSQCLYADGIEMDDGWYCYKDDEWNISESWRLVNAHYEYFTCSEYYQGTVIVNNKSDFVDVIENNNVSIGDIVYFDEDGDGVPNHVGIISYLSSDMIYYADHSMSRLHCPLAVFVNGDGNRKAYIVLLKEVVK